MMKNYRSSSVWAGAAWHGVLTRLKHAFFHRRRELLHQPDLLAYFQTRLKAMPEFNLPIITRFRTPREGEASNRCCNAHIPAESVRKVNEITTRLGTGIVTRVRKLR